MKMGEPRRILVIDDHVETLDLMGDIFADAGHHAELATGVSADLSEVLAARRLPPGLAAVARDVDFGYPVAAVEGEAAQFDVLVSRQLVAIHYTGDERADVEAIDRGRR